MRAESRDGSDDESEENVVVADVTAEERNVPLSTPNESVSLADGTEIDATEIDATVALPLGKGYPAPFETLVVNTSRCSAKRRVSISRYSKEADRLVGQYAVGWWLPAGIRLDWKRS